MVDIRTWELARGLYKAEVSLVHASSLHVNVQLYIFSPLVVLLFFLHIFL
jgi:hypothetical protein